MIFDLILILIILVSAIYGYKKGFMSTFIHSVGWVISLVAAYLLLPITKSLLQSSTGLYDSVYEFFYNRFSGSSVDALEVSTSTLPTALGDSLITVGDNIVEGLATSFADIAFTVLVYIGLFLLLKLILWLLLRLLSREYAGGLRSVGDGILGTVFGLIRGLVICAIFLLAILPVSNLLAPASTDAISSSLESSFFAGFLYSENFLLVLIQGFFF